MHYLEQSTPLPTYQGLLTLLSLESLESLESLQSYRYKWSPTKSVEVTSVYNIGRYSSHRHHND